MNKYLLNTFVTIHSNIIKKLLPIAEWAQIKTINYNNTFVKDRVLYNNKIQIII